MRKSIKPKRNHRKSKRIDWDKLTLAVLSRIK